MNAPLASIVIAAYQSRPDHILAAIDSALSQTMVDFEVLIRDDSPTDYLRSVVSSRIDQRVHYTHNNPSLGVSRNHKQLFSDARGEFIAILNHDDLLEPEFLATLVTQLQDNYNSVLAFCDHWIIDNQGCINTDETDRASLVFGRTGLSQGIHKPFGHLLVAQTIPMAMGTVFRRASLPMTMPDLAGPAYDIWLTYLLASTGGGAFYIPQRLSSWRSHSANLTSGGGLAWLYGSAICWQAVAKDKALIAHWGIAQRLASEKLVACALRSWREGHRIACLHFAAQSLRLRLSIRGFAFLIIPCLPIWLVNALDPNKADS